MRSAGRKPSPRSASVVRHAHTRRPGRGEQVELGAVGVRRVDDGRALAEAAGSREQLDRPAAVLGEALLDLPRLLVRVDVQRQRVRARRSVRSSRASRPGRRARSGGPSPTRRPCERRVLDLGEVRARPSPGGSAAAHRARMQRAEARARCPLPSQRLPRREPRGRRGSGTHRPPCTRPLASRGTRPRSSSGRAPASAARPRRASSRATPRSPSRRRALAAHAGRCGCGR